MLHKLPTNKKAISPIFATLSLLVIVVVLFVPIFYWSTNLTLQAKNDVESSSSVATESITIEEVSLVSGQPCTIYVRNIGKTTVAINNVLIETGSVTKTYDSASNELTIKNPLTGTTKVSANPGELLAITISNLKGLSLISDQLYTVKVFTKNGIGEAFPIVL